VDIGIVYGADKKAIDVDFIARRGDKRYYIQIAFSLPSMEKINQETRSFSLIGDNFRKIIITYENPIFTTLEFGYERVNIIDFLLDENYLK
jgi:hypothetical protein